MSSKTALPVALAVVVFLAVWPAADLLAQNTCPGCSAPAKVVHPNGFGPESYARWMPKLGEPDSNGQNFAMLLVHMTSPLVTTAARAVVAVEGFDGENPDDFTLAYDHPRSTTFAGKYSTCTAGGAMGNPRWSVRYRVPGTAVDNRFQFGCNDSGMTSGDGIIIGVGTSSAGQTAGWERKSLLLTVDPLAVAAAGGSTVIIVSLSIQWDALCAPSLCPGSVLVDDISVTPPGGPTFTWTGPADNGAN